MLDVEWLMVVADGELWMPGSGSWVQEAGCGSQAPDAGFWGPHLEVDCRVIKAGDKMLEAGAEGSRGSGSPRTPVALQWRSLGH